MEAFIGMIAFGASFLFFAIFIYQRDENRRFKDARVVEGRIVDLKRARNGGHYPVVEYSFLGETRTFKNSMSIQGASVGQRIDIEVAADGRARVSTMGNSVVQYAMFVISLAGFLFGMLMIVMGETL